jgi:hypothetical protein
MVLVVVIRYYGSKSFERKLYYQLSVHQLVALLQVVEFYEWLKRRGTA